MSAVKIIEFFGDRISHIVLKGSWCDIIVLNAHTVTDDKVDDPRSVCVRNYTRCTVPFVITV
jgi:hypothetical protein